MKRIELQLLNPFLRVKGKGVLAFVIAFTCLLGGQLLFAKVAHEPMFSVAGFFPLENSGREVFSMNPAWRFHKGALENGQDVNFDDSKWPAVNLPHGLEILPADASGGINYRGEVWYRKHFDLPVNAKGKKLFLHFEAIMGKSRIYVNGQLLKEHFGGYLPIIVDITGSVKHDGKNVIAVWADNSDDPLYPPGKPQDMLDFAYFAGIYRDVWLIAHNQVFITDANHANQIGGGGLFVAFNNVSANSADILLQLHVRNEERGNFAGQIVYDLLTIDGKLIASTNQNIRLNRGGQRHFSTRIRVPNPALWSPENPNLYHLNVRVTNNRGQVMDGFMRRVGIRSIDFRGKDGFWLNGKPYGKPLIGANRHQDFPLVGNAVANSVHWRDAKKLRDAGLKVIRNAHYPQDPAFMDAADELGLFVIVNTPGWQFWNENPPFEERIYSDIRNMVRRDRNHPSVLLWEPVLNETWYPAHFAKNAHDIVMAEFPFPYVYTGSDAVARGSEHFTVLFGHPAAGDDKWIIPYIDANKNYFTREWGDNVDDWSSHNSPSRVRREWGEEPMLIQAHHYADPPYKYTSLDVLHQTPLQHFGGTLWHPFDHNRGYHPDPFFGGIMDAFRQPKYSYYMFKSQRDPAELNPISESGPLVFIAHQMSPFSPADVTVFSNCDEVRLQVFEGGKVHTYIRNRERVGMPSPIITFENAWDFMGDKERAMNRRHAESFMLAEGLIDGKVVATHKIRPARRPSKLLLWVDNENVEMRADGSDFAVVVAAVADQDGFIRRLNNYQIYFEVEGDGSLVGANNPLVNPVGVQWGTAAAIVQAGLKPGTIRVRARVIPEGVHKPLSAELEISTFAPRVPLLYSASEAARIVTVQQGTHLSPEGNNSDLVRENERLQQEINRLRLQEVEQQQREFGETR